MFVLPALKRLDDPRLSAAGTLSSGQKTARTVKAAGARVLKRDHRSQSGPGSIHDDEFCHDDWQTSRRMLFRYRVCAPGDVSLAPTTAGYFVDRGNLDDDRKKSPKSSVALLQFDQYRRLIERKLAAKLPPPPLEEPKLPEESEIEAVAVAKSPIDLAKVFTPIQLPQRRYIPAPVRSGRIFEEAENKTQEHKLYKTGWIKLSGNRG